MRVTNRPLAVMMGIIATICVGWFLHQAQGILQPLVIAMLLAIMLQPVVLGLRRYRVPPVITVVGLVVLTFLGLLRLGSLLQENILAYFGEQPLTEQTESGEELETGERVSGWPAVDAALRRRIRESELPQATRLALLDGLDQVREGNFVTDAIGTGFGFMKGLFLVVIYMLFIFAEQAVFRRKILEISGGRAGEAREILEGIARGIQRYLGIKTVISLATGATCYVGLVLLDIPFALLFGFVTFLLNYIPTFGSIIAGIFPTLTALALEENSLSTAVLVALLYIATNAFFGTFLEPRILGRELNLSPLVVLVSVVAWAGLWGVPGTFLAVPLTSAIQIILANFENTRPIAVLLSSGPPRPRRRSLPAAEGGRDPRWDPERNAL